MNDKPLISVIIPVYNAEKYLRQCLDSVVNQTLKNIEIICVNDGSTDNSRIILEEYKKKYKNIKLINQKNEGVNGARISGYNNATGIFIAWVDADDFIENDMYEKMYKLAINNNSDIVICNYNFYPNKVTNKEKWFKEYNGKVDTNFVSRNTIQWNKIVKKQLLDNINITYLFSTVGEGCYSLVLIETNKISTTSECLYNYRVGHISLSNNFKDIEWYKKTIIRSLKKYEYVVEKEYSDTWKKFFKSVYLYYVLILMIVSAYNGDKKLYIECKNTIKNECFFSDEYQDYLNSHFSKSKILFFKYIGINSYLLTHIVSKIIM